MKIIVHTEYENVSEEWFMWWLKRFEGLPEYRGFEYKLNTYGNFTLKNQCPEEDKNMPIVSAVTTYKIEK